MIYANINVLDVIEYKLAHADINLFHLNPCYVAYERDILSYISWVPTSPAMTGTSHNNNELPHFYLVLSGNFEVCVVILPLIYYWW